MTSINWERSTIHKLMEITDEAKHTISDMEYIQICNILKCASINLKIKQDNISEQVLITVPVTTPRPIPSPPEVIEPDHSLTPYPHPHIMEITQLTSYINLLKTHVLSKRILLRDKAKVAFELVEELDIQQPTSVLNMIAVPSQYINDTLPYLKTRPIFGEFGDRVDRERNARLALEKKLKAIEISISREHILELKTCVSSS